MSTSAIFPFGTTNKAFPDNGLLTQNYDMRVSQNDMARIGAKLMHSQPAYVREENLLGEGVYTWEPDFIAMIDASLLSGIKSNFSKVQSKLFSDYVTFLQSGATPLTSEAVLKLDAYLGSRQ